MCEPQTSHSQLSHTRYADKGSTLEVYKRDTVDACHALDRQLISLHAHLRSIKQDRQPIFNFQCHYLRVCFLFFSSKLLIFRILKLTDILISIDRYFIWAIRIFQQVCLPHARLLRQGPLKVISCCCIGGRPAVGGRQVFLTDKIRIEWLHHELKYSTIIKDVRVAWDRLSRDQGHNKKGACQTLPVNVKTKKGIKDKEIKFYCCLG